MLAGALLLFGWKKHPGSRTSARLNVTWAMGRVQAQPPEHSQSSLCCKWILTCWELLSALLVFSWAFRRSSGNHPSAGSGRVPPARGGFGMCKNEIKAPLPGEAASPERMSTPINVSLMCSSGVGSFGSAEVITTPLQSLAHGFIYCLISGICSPSEGAQLFALVQGNQWNSWRGWPLLIHILGLGIGLREVNTPLGLHLDPALLVWCLSPAPEPRAA